MLDRKAYTGGYHFIVHRLLSALDRRARTKLNTFLASQACAKFGVGSVIQDRVFIGIASQISIGSNCLISSGVRISSEIESATLKIGDNVQVNRDVFIDHTGGINIGDGALISEGAIVYSHDHGLDPRSAPKGFEKEIGNGAWIGARAVILPTCRSIGPNSVIGVGSIVTRDVPENAVVAGNPAVLLRSKK